MKWTTLLLTCSVIFFLTACQSAPAVPTPQSTEITAASVRPVPATATTTATSIPTLTATAPPAATSTTAPIKPVNINAFCTIIGKSPKTVVHQGTPINILWGWSAKTEQQINDFLQNNITEITLDGTPLTGKMSGGIQKNQSSGEPEVAWYADVGVLSPGQHTVTYDVKWKKLTDDGTTQYGPGTAHVSEHDECQIIVESQTATPAAAAGTGPGVGSTQTREKDGMLMVNVPAGPFTMGSDHFDVEKPIQTVSLDAFWIDRTEVTNAMFTLFVKSEGYVTDAQKAGKSTIFSPASKKWELDTKGADWQHPQGPGSSLAGLDQHPVVHVSWNDASAYCAWAGARLPSETEWEKAARGTDGRTYPWGETAPNDKLVNFANVFQANFQKPGYLFTTPVGSYTEGASPYGALDMAGNVWEWVADWFAAYPGNSTPDKHYGTQYRVERGGSWFNTPENLRSAYRYLNLPTGTVSNVGFRCAK